MLSRGMISEPVCQIPVDMNKVGIILRGGLNPVACAQETGIEVENRAMSTVMAYSDLAYSGDIIPIIIVIAGLIGIMSSE